MSAATASAPVGLADKGAALGWLDDLYGSADSGALSLAEFSDPEATARVSWFGVGERRRAAGFVASAADEGRTAYVGIGLRYRPLRNNRRGDASDVCGIPGLWGDVDYFDPRAHKRVDLPPDSEAGLAIIRDATPSPPSMIVDSGFGFYAFLLFREFLTFDDDAERERAASLLKRYQLALRIAAGEHYVDGVGDLARVLKAPGSVNWKIPSDPRPVRIIHDGGPRYTMDELEEILPQLGDEARRGFQTYAGARAALLPEEFEEAVAIFSESHRDGARHFSALHVAGACARAGFPEEDTARIVDHISASDRNPTDRQKAVRDTYARLRAGKPVSGYCGLRDAVGMPPELLARWDRLRDRYLERTDPRPWINIGDQDLERSSKACWDALEGVNSPPRLFLYGNRPTRIERDPETGAPIPRVLDVAGLRHEVARAARFYRVTPKGEKVSARPAEAVIKDMLADPRPPLPPLATITEVPVYAADASLPDQPGYHASSQTYYAPAPSFQAPAIPERPTPEDIAKARFLIGTELLGDFPFIHEAERTHAVALTLLPFVRNMIPAPTPMHLIEKPAPGTGATLLVDAISTIATGRPAPAMTEGRDEDDMRKRLTGALLLSPPILFFDNLRRTLDYSCLAAAITETRWRDRILGTSGMADLAVRCAWVATGNNPQLSSEMTRRTIGIRLDAKQAQPWLRSGFRHPNLRAWVKANRAELVAACLTLVQAWIARGKPVPRDLVTIGMFEEWSAVMGGILEVAGFEGFLANREEFYARSDTEGDDVRGFLSAWWEDHGAAKVKVSTLFTIASGPDSTLDITAKTDQGQRVRLGKVLSAIEDRRYQLSERLTVRVLRTGEKEKGAVLWQLESGESAPEKASITRDSPTDSPADSPEENPHNHAENGHAETPLVSVESLFTYPACTKIEEEAYFYPEPSPKDSPDSPDSPAESLDVDCLGCGAALVEGQTYCRDCDPRGM